MCGVVLRKREDKASRSRLAHPTTPCDVKHGWVKRPTDSDTEGDLGERTERMYFAADSLSPCRGWGKDPKGQARKTQVLVLDKGTLRAHTK